jgi:poly(A) polymerase
MPAPIVIPRSDHPISRQHIDPDALKVLYRLRQFNHIAYLVGGSVRDLLLGRTPKDFDIGTSAHPYQVKRLFRNCWIIGRRFRLAHVKFGPKIIEVATFRRQIPAGTEEEPVAQVPPEPPSPDGGNQETDVDRLIQHDNTFGTPEEDAFRRDFTLNGLFYDIETRSIIDYVGGLEDIRARVIRCIGDPEERFQEDPVRMLRAVAFASRLDFSIDEPVLQAIERCHGELARSAPARLMEEVYKIMRAGHAENTFRSLVDTGLLAAIAPEVPGRMTPAFWQSVAAVDARRRADPTADALPNPILLGSLLIPLGLLDQHHGHTKELGARFGILPLARRDVESLRQILLLQRHLRDVNAPPRHRRSVMHRTAFGGALAWLELHGHASEVVQMWKSLKTEHGPIAESAGPVGQRRRRRRRRRRRSGPAI